MESAGALCAARARPRRREQDLHRAEVQLDAPALQRAGHGDEPMRTGASSSASSSTTATSSIEDLKRQQQLQTHVDSALVRSKRFYFSRRADTRLRLIQGDSSTAQRALFRAFDANDTGKIEFDELCEMLARVKQVRGSSVREMAELAFAWFQGDKSEAVLTHPDVKLLAVTVMELEGDSKAQTEHGYDLQHQVTKQNFCQEMDCELGAHVLHVLLAPFGVVKALLDEETILQEADNTRWKAGTRRTSCRVAGGRNGGDTCNLITNQTSNNNQREQEAGEQQVQQQQQQHVAECHPRPGPIANSDICGNEQLGTLRPGLVEDEDFVLISSAVWKRLVQVYGGGPEFPRQIMEVSSCAEHHEMPSSEEDGKPNEGTGVNSNNEYKWIYILWRYKFDWHVMTRDMCILCTPAVLATPEVTIWLRRRRLQSWARLECSLEAPHATLEGLQITSAQELLVDFRALDIDEDAQSIAQQRRRISITSMAPQTPFTVAMLQPVGNDFVCCPRSSLAKFAKTGDWKILRESMAAEQEAAASASAVSAHVGPAGVLVGLAKHMEAAKRTSRGRLIQHDGLRATGLINMGNTCFMNSALQCFVHSPVFREYFLSNRYEAEVNKKNHLGSRGAVAAAYAQLQALFGVSSVDGDQQANDEATESSSDEARGNAAWLVVDLFHGQMRSETVCSTCGERKCTFDPNLFFSLPIPESNFVRVEQGFWLRRGSNVGELCDRIAEVHGRAAGNRFLLVEVRRNRIKRIVEGDEAVDKLATAAPGSLSAYERAWTLAEIPAVPATIRDYFNDGNVAGDAKTIIAEKIRSFSDLRVGSRVDARDNHNDWHPGTVIEVAGGSETEQDDTNRKQHQRVCVHFDAFSSKWNKWFTARDWKAKRLQPLATRTSKSTEVFEVQVVHRFASQPSSVAASESGQTSGDDHSFAGILPSSQKVSISSSHERLSINVFGTPLFVTIASDKTAQDMHQALFLQTARFWREFNGDPESTGNTQHKDLKQTSYQDLTSERGEPLPTDSSALLQHFSTRSVLALDWFEVHDYSSCEERAPEDVPDEVAEAAKADPDLRADLDAAASSKETTCMDALMREEAISLEDHWVSQALPYLENQHKQKVRALVDFPLKGLDFSKWMGHQDEGSSVYDLYAVANHVADFPESSALFKTSEESGDVQCPELWFRFDDEKVSEIAAGDVVTDAAYVLFYKRRTLSPHNVLQYAL
ncbi:Ubiquitin specific protease domain [Phytophthora cactorum]|nr:Ubiquitin specific protease domain [Phytophthora cactorum]